MNFGIHSSNYIVMFQNETMIKGLTVKIFAYYALCDEHGGRQPLFFGKAVFVHDITAASLDEDFRNKKPHILLELRFVKNH